SGSEEKLMQNLGNSSFANRQLRCTRDSGTGDYEATERRGGHRTGSGHRDNHPRNAGGNKNAHHRKKNENYDFKNKFKKRKYFQA
ncbi:MAG TPA: hypothetical protein PK821_08605, partial [Victivallales bacterium]|nr:hypothetical protein [Victivallales bacterium]